MMAQLMTQFWQVRPIEFNDFYTNFLKIRSQRQRSDTVLIREGSFYEGNCKSFLGIFDDDKVVATAAITNDGEVISVIGADGYSRVSKNLLTASLIYSGLKLDCYNVSFLWKAYNYAGFRPVAKYSLNKKEIDDVKEWWDESKDGTDYEIIYWIFDKKNISPLNATPPPDLDERKKHIREFKSKIEAEKYRDKLAYEEFHIKSLIKSI
ncbi:MAG: hypothetical protein K2L12_06265 [Clostridia bacterium]|nr:hypothetical protein [Clostridia bacterium]